VVTGSDKGPITIDNGRKLGQSLEKLGESLENCGFPEGSMNTKYRLQIDYEKKRNAKM